MEIPHCVGMTYLPLMLVWEAGPPPYHTSFKMNRVIPRPNSNKHTIVL